MKVGGGSPGIEGVQLQPHRAGADVGDDGNARRPVQRHAYHPSRDNDGDRSPRPGQKAFDLGRAAVELDLAHVETAHVEHGIPGRTLDLKAPRIARIELDLSKANASQAPDHDCFAADDGRRRARAIAGRQAAFKNFTQPESTLDEMYRVLRAGGTAVIQDMAREASHADIEQEVRQMELGLMSSFMTVTVLEWLRRRAYATDRSERLAASSRFRASEIHGQGITLEVRMKKPAH